MTAPRSDRLDPAIPMSGLLLDQDRVTSLLAAAAGGAEVGAVEVKYLRWKPGTNLVVRYDLHVAERPTTATAFVRADGAGCLAHKAVDPANLSLAGLAAARSAVSSPLWHDPATDVLVQWLPLDLRLPALARGAAALAERAGASDSCSKAVELLAYKPRRRAVHRVGDVVVKAYAVEADASRAGLAARMAAVALGPHAAEPIGANLEDRSITQAWVPGRACCDQLQSVGELRDVVERLHVAAPVGLPEGGAGPQMVRATQTAELVAAALPELAGTLDRLVDRLAATVPPDGPVVLCHGDLSVDQLVDSPGRGLVLLDLDEAVAGPAILDWTSYVAAGVRRVDDLAAADDTLANLAPRLGPAESRWWLATSLLRLAATPLRQLHDGWPHLLAERLTAAEAVLNR